MTDEAKLSDSDLAVNCRNCMPPKGHRSLRGYHARCFDGSWFLFRRDAHCGIPTPADPNSRLTIWVYRWPSSWSNCRASRKAATGSLSYAVRRASFSQYETPGSARISLRFILTFTARVSINLDTDSASSRNRLPSPILPASSSIAAQRPTWSIKSRPDTPPSTREYYLRDHGKIRAGCRG